MPGETTSRELPRLDENGLLTDPTQWSEAVAQSIAVRHGVTELSEAHWKIIHSLREHYASYGVAPAVSHICTIQGMERYCAHTLFHTALNAWRIAGLPDPGEEAKTYLSAM